MLKLWTWLSGKKVPIAVVASVVVSVLGRRGIEVPSWIFDFTDGLLGLGLAHRTVKAVGAKGAAILATLTGAVACSTAAPSAPQPAIAPVNQAGSPVTITFNVRASDVRTSEQDKQDAGGAVTTKGGTQDATATTETKTDATATIPVR